MQSTATRWIAAGVVVLGVAAVVASYALLRAGRRPLERRPAGRLPPSAGIAAPASPAPAGSSSAQPVASAPAQPRDPAAIPTVRLPCVDDRTELRMRSSGGNGSPEPVLCWGDHCISNKDEPVASPPGPSAVASAVVSSDRVCTGARCDSLGPQLRATLARPDPDRRLSATRDHAAIVIRRDFKFEAWNRALDRRIDVGSSPMENWIDRTFDTEPESIDVIGDFLLVAWSCHEFCSATATILDARGRPTKSPDLNMEPLSVRDNRHRQVDSVVAMGDDRFLVFGLFGEVAMIAHGRVVAGNTLLRPGSAQAISLIQAQAIPDDTEHDGPPVEALWCAGASCEVTKIAGRRDDHHEWSLSFDRDVTLPLCPTP